MAAYESLTDVISDIAIGLDQTAEATYSVVWETQNHNHGSEYRVVASKPLAMEQTLIVEGQSRGGRYQIVPRGSGPAVVRYLRKDNTVGWEEEATELIIMHGRFQWSPENGGTLIDRIKDKFPR